MHVQACQQAKAICAFLPVYMTLYALRTDPIMFSKPAQGIVYKSVWKFKVGDRLNFEVMFKTRTAVFYQV